MRLYYWSWQGRWKDVGDMGGLVLSLDEALDEIANTDIFWTRPEREYAQSQATESSSSAYTLM